MTRRKNLWKHLFNPHHLSITNVLMTFLIENTKNTRGTEEYAIVIIRVHVDDQTFSCSLTPFYRLIFNNSYLIWDERLNKPLRFFSLYTFVFPNWNARFLHTLWRTLVRSLQSIFCLFQSYFVLHYSTCQRNIVLLFVLKIHTVPQTFIPRDSSMLFFLRICVAFFSY